jgi:hypothetical protein
MSMNLLPGRQRVTADTIIGSGRRGVRIYSVHLISGATASTCYLRNGITVSADVDIEVDGVANTGVTLNFAGGVVLPLGCFFDADANITSAIVTFTEEN